jgi:hypothetical protein
MSALDKVLRLSGAAPAPAQEDTGAELVLAAALALDELRICLAADPDDDEDDDSDDQDDDQQGDDHAGHTTYKALMKKKFPPKRAAKMCAQADKKVKASALCEAAAVALSGLDRPQPGWAERTAGAPFVALAGGNTDREMYCDPGWRSDGKPRYPVTRDGKPDAARIRLSWAAAASLPGGYTGEQKDRIRTAIKLAAAQSGVRIDGDGDKTAAVMVALAAAQAVPMQHPPFTGKHSHGHQMTSVHDHEHQHFNDSSHGGGPAHRTGSAPGRPYDW